ncbi:MAG: hypothetical protein E7292_03125 [Lachnospiraceae bacterium]|nr:hypothetical protein [Lachnospiraceae bacterium]
MHKDDKRTFPVERIIFAVLLAVYTGVMLYLFVMQCYEVPVFRSDMPDYVNEVRGIKGDYEFPYPLLFTLAKGIALFAGAPLGMAIATALLNALGVCVTKYYMDKEVKTGLNVEEWSRGKLLALDLSITFMVFAMFLLGNLYSPKNTAFFGFDYAYRCMGIYTPNPIWNATYLATRPFTIICFFEAAKVLKNYQRNFTWKGCMPFAVSLLLMTITKPSYTLVLVPLMGILLLVDLIRSKGKSLKNAFLLCVTMIPTGLHLLYQFFGVFTGTNVKGEETGIGISFGLVWNNYTKSIPLSIVMGMALTLGVLVLNLVFNYKTIREKFTYRFAWYNYLVGMAMFLFLYEKGFRMEHANFSWGYMHGMFFVFFMTLVLVLRNTMEWRKSWKAIFLPAEWAVFGYHLVCGVNFLWYALQGNDLAGF